ncbi:hypothetical protein ACS15_0933 [Ralstonia insidiosa]|uniref:Uncharacterized protein n=1 Tax=Ralstonia insidiosa TaxID=190721 RepID=A0AAC9FQJ6_9RALS|nr:hypothetical protein ACS15_0933 [Ralstonia insidiosa]
MIGHADRGRKSAQKDVWPKKNAGRKLGIIRLVRVRQGRGG